MFSQWFVKFFTSLKLDTFIERTNLGKILFVNYIKKACTNAWKQNMILFFCKIENQIMSFLNFLHGKRRKALRKRRKELDKFLTEHDKLKLKLVNSTT